MGKREKIFVCLMIGALLYGGFELFYSSSPRLVDEEWRHEVETARKLLEQTTEIVRETELKPSESLVLELTSRSWDKNPFYVWTSSEDNFSRIKPDDEYEDFVFSGFFEMGDTKMAVINGIEYQVGDKLEGADLKVVNVLPEKVTLISGNSGLEISIPYEDTILVD
ncbi:MAG: hypothetical protein D5R98_05445 [Desulfonatronovibrio sp. MSAO_Bac4]|nr:MAG: hypothetical protein D5R98_05445 [Desulfonatronovibrio sp. MSAO_Bac4]